MSIKLAADSSVERGAAVRRKPESTAVPPPHSFSWGRGEAQRRAGEPSTVPGTLSAGDSPDGQQTLTFTPQTPCFFAAAKALSSVPRFSSCSCFSLRRGTSEDGGSLQLMAGRCRTTGALRYNYQAPSQSLCPGRTPPQGGCWQSGHAGSVQHGA